MVLALLQAGGRLEERDLAALRWVLFAGGSFPDQAPAAADGKATTPSLCQPLRTDRNECLRLL
jgi:hypothetical protein